MYVLLTMLCVLSIIFLNTYIFLTLLSHHTLNFIYESVTYRLHYHIY